MTGETAMTRELPVTMRFSLRRWLYDKRYYIIAFFMPAIILFAAYAVFGVHPFGDESVLVLDLNAQYIYYFEYLRKAFWGDWIEPRSLISWDVALVI